MSRPGRRQLDEPLRVVDVVVAVRVEPACSTRTALARSTSVTGIATSSIFQFWRLFEAIGDMLDESVFVDAIGAFRRHLQLTPACSR